MAVSQPVSEKEGKSQVNLTNCSFNLLVVGDGNTVNNHCRCLQYPELSKTSRSGGNRMTAIQDGGNWRGKKRKQTKIPFPQRKHRPDPKMHLKRGSSDSDEEIVRYNGPKISSIASGDSKINTTRKFYSVLKRLHPLRDSGNWKGFNSLADNILRATEGDLELENLIQIEKSVVISYQNDLEGAETMVLEALENILEGLSLEKAKVEVHNFLVTMAHLHLTGFYRRQNKHGKAEHCIAVAEQSSKNVNSRFLKALIYYEMASNLTKYISSIPPDRSVREGLVEQAKNFMKQCIDLCVELDGDDSVYIKKHHFGLLKLALMNLNCRTRATRSQMTACSLRCVEEAENCIKMVEAKYEHEMSEGQKIQLFVAKSDLHYRQFDLQGAMTHASKALDLAENHGFSLEINGIKERLDDICKLMTSKEAMTLKVLHTDEHMESLSSSTSPSQKNSPYSSGCEME